MFYFNTAGYSVFHVLVGSWMLPEEVSEAGRTEERRFPGEVAINERQNFKIEKMKNCNMVLYSGDYFRQ
jgi:hypothetical protein